MAGDPTRARTAAALAGLPADQWSVLGDVHDRRHIVVGPPGVFAIDSKDWQGSITVRANQLRQNGERRDDVAESAARAAQSMLALGIRPDLVHSVVCFERNDALTAWVNDARICSSSNLVTMLRAASFALTADEVRGVAQHLEAQLKGAVPPPLPSNVLAVREPAQPSSPSRRLWWRRSNQLGSANRGSRSK